MLNIEIKIVVVDLYYNLLVSHSSFKSNEERTKEWDVSIFAGKDRLESQTLKIYKK